MKISLAHMAVLACLVGALAWYGLNGPLPFAEANATTNEQTASVNPASTPQTGAFSSLHGAGNGSVRLTLIKFHGNQQCTSCINLGKFANATLQQGYATELSSGTIHYLDINAETEPQNELVLKYQPTHASLYLVIDRSGTETIEELTQAWFYTSDDAAYAKYLSGVIDARLS